MSKEELDLYKKLKRQNKLNRISFLGLFIGIILTVHSIVTFGDNLSMISLQAGSYLFFLYLFNALANNKCSKEITDFIECKINNDAEALEYLSQSNEKSNPAFILYLKINYQRY